jgi:predicted TIM-barrel fold metal-dependent hydrolase
MPGKPIAIDADGHLGLPDTGLSTYIDPSYRDKLAERDARQTRRFENLPGGGVRGNMRPGYADPVLRLPDMDLEGIEVSVLFGGGNGEEWAELDPGFAAALCRAWNDAMADYCRGGEGRLHATAKLPLIDMDASVAELRRAVGELGFVGATVTQHVRERNLDDPYFDPLYAAAEELDVPICVHGGGQAVDQFPIGVDRLNTRLTIHSFTHPVGHMFASMCVVCGGVLERFPKLRVAFLEGGIGWLPFWIERLDEHYELMPEQAPALKTKPGDYFLGGRVFVSCDPDEHMLGSVTNVLGEDLTLYASDYYHWDCKFPETVNLINNREELPASAKHKIFQTNPRRLYGL